MAVSLITSRRPWKQKPDLSRALRLDPERSKGLVGFWGMVEGAGQALFDLSGNKNSGTNYNSPLWVPGNNGPALSFNGTNQYVGVPYSDALNFAGKITIAAAVNVTTFPPQDPSAEPYGLGTIVSRGYDGSVIPYYLDVRHLGDGSYQLRVGSYGPGADVGTTWAFTLSEFSTGVDHRAVGVYDGISWILYFDGRSVASAVKGTGAQTNTKQLTIGAFDNAGAIGRYLNARISDVRIFAREFTSAEASSDYENPNGIWVPWSRKTYFDVTAPSGQTIAVGQAAETDIAQAIARKKQKAIAQISETDAAQSIASAKLIAIGQATETDTAQALSCAKRKGIGQATETDSAQPISQPGTKTIAVGLVTETEFAQAISHYKRLGILQAAESDGAHAVSVAKRRELGQASETDYALAISSSGGSPTTLTIADLNAIWDDIEIEPGISPRMALRIILAAIGGKRAGIGTATEYYYAQDGTTPRITFTPTDENGNGTPTLDGS